MRSFLVGLFVAVGLAGLGCGDDAGARVPRIDSLAPATAQVGAQVAIVGANFCGEIGESGDGSCAGPVSGFVTFGTAPAVVRATVASWKDDEIQASVPSGVSTGATTVVVTVEGIQSNAQPFDVQ